MDLLAQHFYMEGFRYEKICTKGIAILCDNCFALCMCGVFIYHRTLPFCDSKVDKQ